MKNLILFLIFLFGCECMAFDIVYPKRKDVTINAESTFFIGSSNKPLKINGQEVPLHNSGGFAYVVTLNNGKNTFVVQDEDKREIFVITKPVIKNVFSSPKFVEFDEIKYFYVINEASPLRSTPINAGINRISHLQQDILLKVDGEKNGFYRVILNSKTYAWIAKYDVKQCDEKFNSAKLNGYDFIQSPQYYTYIFHLNKRVPFEINEKFLIKFYDIEGNPDNTYTMDIQQKFPVLGYNSGYDGNDFVLNIRKPLNINSKKPLKNIKIALDAGHGGSEKGAVGCLGHLEKDITLSITKYLEIELKNRGAKVFLTRDDDIYVGLKDRVEKSNKQDTVVLLSIHGNALPDGYDPNQISGTSIYYYYEQAKPLADILLETMVSELGLCDDKVRQGSLALVRNTNALSLLKEVAYLINPVDNAKLINENFQKECAKAIADGLEKYFSRI